MRKISCYLYPNRIQLLADVAGSIPTEYTNVYQRTVKIYQGVDNVLEFDIKNADQKRLELLTDPVITDIQVNIIDEAGNSVGSYPVTPRTDLKGIATATIPSSDLAAFVPQFFRYSVTATKDTAHIPLYADSRFGAVGTIELIGSAMPVTRPEKMYNTFTGEIDFSGNVMHRSSAIPAKFYEAIPTASLTFAIEMKDFIGTVYIEGTTDMTISVNSFLNATKLQSYTTNVATTSTQTFSNVAVGDYNYFRVTWMWPNIGDVQSPIPMDIYGGYGANNGPGKVVSVTVS